MNNTDFDIIHTIRNPLSAISSPVNNWLKYNSGKDFFAESIYFHLDLIVNPSVKGVFMIRSKMINEIRSFLNKRNKSLTQRRLK